MYFEKVEVSIRFAQERHFDKSVGVAPTVSVGSADTTMIVVYGEAP